MVIEADPWDDNSLAPLDGNDPYTDRAMDNNERVTKLVNEGAATENSLIMAENSRLKTQVREAEYALKNNMKQFNEDKKQLEEKYQEAVTEVNRLEFRAKDGKEVMEQKIQELQQALAKASRENDALRFNCARFEVYIENEVKEDMKMVDQEEEKVNHELQKLEQQLLQAKEQAQNRLAETQKQRIKKRQDARKRMDLLKRVRNSTTRHTANVSSGGPNGYNEADGGSDLHAPLPAFDEGLEADLAVRPPHQRRESERSFRVVNHHELFDDHHLGDIDEGEFDFDHDEEHSLEHTCITPSPTKGKREGNETDDVESEEEKPSDDDEEMSEESTAASKVPGTSVTKNTEKKKTVKRHRTRKTKKDRRRDVLKFRKMYKGKPIEKWSREALKAECIYKKQKGDGAVPEKKSDLLALHKIRAPRPSPPCSDAEDWDNEEKKEEKKEEEQVESKDDHDDDDNDDDTEIDEDESVTEGYKAGEDVEEYKAGDDAEEYKPEEDDDEDEF